jgi:hypothetical protein
VLVKAAAASIVAFLSIVRARRPSSCLPLYFVHAIAYFLMWLCKLMLVYLLCVMGAILLFRY